MPVPRELSSPTDCGFCYTTGLVKDARFRMSRRSPIAETLEGSHLYLAGNPAGEVDREGAGGTGLVKVADARGYGLEAGF
jgi:hypothetical protein